jgi:hypothetical protein
MVVANPLKYPEDLCLECGVELDAFLLYSTSGIVQIMPEEFMKGLRIVDPSRAAYLLGPCCFVASRKRISARGSSLNRFMSEGDGDGDQ